MRLPWRRRPDFDEPAWQRATAEMYAKSLTQTGSRCHLNEGSTRFCHWRAEELPSTGDGPPQVGVRCSIHHGGRYLDASARLAAEDFAPTRD